MEHLSEILNLILQYSKDKKLADENFVISLVNICSKDKQLNEYIKDVKFMKNTSGELCSGLYHNKVITVYSNTTRLTNAKIMTFIKDNPRDEYLLKNIVISQIVLHEVEHALQRKIITEFNNNKSLEDNLLKISSQIPYRLAEKNYAICLRERLAEIHSYQKIVSVLELIKELVPALFKMEKQDLLGSYLKGYYPKNPKLFSPTIRYLKVGGRKDDLSRFNWFDSDNERCLNLCKENLSFKDRITYGLPIDNEEYNFIKKKSQN